MKKILLVLLFLSFSFFSKAQEIPVGEYIVEAEGRIKFTTFLSSSSKRNELHFDINFNNNTEIKLVNLNNFRYNEFIDIKEEIKFSSSIEIIGYLFFLKTGHVFSGLIGLRKEEIYPPYNFILYSDHYSKGKDYFNLRVTVTPQLTILNDKSEKYLPTDDKIVIHSHKGFSYNEYNWCYSLDYHNWIDLPKYGGQSSIEINARDIFGENVNKYEGKEIHIKQKYGNISSNHVRFRVLKSAPRLNKNNEKIYTTCYDSKDGAHELHFDRPLDENEELHLGIFDINKGIIIKNQKIIEFDSKNRFLLDSLPAGNYRFKIIGTYNNGLNLYSPTTVEPYKFTIHRHEPVDFSIDKTDVRCYDGSDGEIHITAKGGVAGYEYQLDNGEWIPFSDATSAKHTISGLKANKYKLKLRDKNKCEAKIQKKVDNNGPTSLGEIKELEIELTAPKQALKIYYTEAKEPTHNGATNGMLVAKVDGGTIFEDNKYWYEWKNASGKTFLATTQYTSGSYYITLDGIPAGMYYLTIRDKNYDGAKDKKGCTVIKSQIELAQPDPLTASIELVNPISCHVDNEFGNETDLNPIDGQRDESQDGVLKVIAKGGKPFTGNENRGEPYKYTWKKQNKYGSWETLPETKGVLSQLSHGNYAVNIEDANGIVIGEYKNNELTKVNDIEYLLAQPEKLEINFETLNSTCLGADGFAKAVVTGGVPPYSYSWSNGETTAQITGLEAMPYYVSITDSRGCKIEGSIVINQPDNIVITDKVQNILCYNASNASIELTVEGGTGPYRFLWNTGATTSAIKNLSAGDYKVTITDAQGCSYVKTYSIDNPEEIKIDLGEDHTLCNGQSLELDIRLKDDEKAKYLWTSDNGFTSTEPIVTLVEAGTYKATVTTGKGCIVSDEIVITQSKMDIDSEFFLTTQAYVNEEVILVNVANPRGESTEWIIDNDNVIVVDKNDDYITLKFPDEGEYTIGLKQIQGDCFMLFNKKIIVEQSNDFNERQNVNAGFVKEFTVSPNPNDGIFDIIVKLEEESPIGLRLFNATGKKVISDKKEPLSKEHHVNFNVKLTAGIYMLVLETPYQTLTKKIVIR